MRRSARPVNVSLSLACLGLVLGSSACAGSPSPLAPRSDGAARIAELGWMMIGLATIVCIVVFAAMLIGLRTQPHDDELALRRADSDRNEARADRVVVLAGMVVPAAILAFTFGYTVHTLRQTAGVAGAGGAAFAAHGEHAGHRDVPPVAAANLAPELAITITGHQWWWQIEYSGEQLVTANEIHVPAGVPVRMTVTSQDVIHSFWIPQIAGKVDLIPAKLNTITLVAPQSGVFRGMCSEFCGLQHAHMHLWLAVEPVETFSAWLDRQRQPPVAPATPSAAEGQRTFIARCGDCHTVRGVSSGASGPDLTHLASRATLGAGIHENDRAHLAGWTTNAQSMKPGNRMPNIPLSEADLTSLLDYLETLE